MLVEQVPRTGRLAEVEGFDREVQSLVHGYLEARKQEIRVPDLQLAAFVIVSTVEALSHGAVLHHPELLSRNKVKTFTDEVTRLVLGYLR